MPVLIDRDEFGNTGGRLLDPAHCLRVLLKNPMYIDKFDELLARYNALRLWKDIGVPVSYRLVAGPMSHILGAFLLSLDKHAGRLTVGEVPAINQDATLGFSYNGQFGSGLTDQGLKANFAVRF